MTYSTSFNNITEHNNTLVYSANGIVMTAVVPPGQYTARALAVALSNAAVPTAMHPSGVRFEFIQVPGQTLIIGLPGTTMHSPLGLAVGASLQVPGVSPYIIDLAGPRQMLVNIDLPISATDSSALARGHLGAVPIAAPLNRIVFYESSNPLPLPTSFMQLNKVVITVEDEQLRPIDFQGVHWALQLVFD
jgi:hypothetical protein